MSAFETDPLGWTEEWDEANQCYFFYHAASGESSWERPVGLPESEEYKEFIAMSEQTTTSFTGEITSEIAEEASQWTVGWDETYQAEFFYNTITEETVWDKPQCLIILHSQEVVVVDEVNQAASSDPANWKVEWDSSYGCDFYFNTVTEESSWEMPACLVKETSEEQKEEVVEEQKEEEVTKEDDVKEEDTNEEKDKKEEVKEDVENVTDSVSTLKLVPLPKKPACRQNSILRRPSARPDMVGLKLSVPPPPSSPSPSTNNANVTSPTLPATSKRRQSLAPRPSAPAPTQKPVVVQEIKKEEEKEEKKEEKNRSRMSSVFASVDDDSNMLLEGDEDEDEDEDDDVTDDNAKRLVPSDAISDVYLNAFRGNSVRNLDPQTGVETKREKPRAIGTYLLKKSPAMMKSWQKRYVVLKDSHLKYYASKGDYDDDKPPKGDIKIAQIPAEDIEKSVYIVGPAKKEIHIRMKGDETADKKTKASKDRLLVLQAVDENTATEWSGLLKDWVNYVH